MIRPAHFNDPYSVRRAPSVQALFKEANLFDARHVNGHVPKPEPEPQPNPEPDAAIFSRADQAFRTCDISPTDWDALFHAVTARLEACSGPANPRHLPEHRLGASATLQVTVRECAASLKRLHAALMRERQQHQSGH